MSCLSDGKLQEYLDSELTEDELQSIRNHLGSCKSCRIKLDQMKVDSEYLHRLLMITEPRTAHIPNLKFRKLNPRGIWLVISSIAAASLLLIIVLIGPEKRSLNQVQYLEIHEQLMDQYRDYDPNLLWHEQQSYSDMVRKTKNPKITN